MMKLFFKSVALSLLGVCFLSCSSYYQGPMTKNFDGTYFQNSQQHDKGFSDLFKFAAGGPSYSWPDSIPVHKIKPKDQRIKDGMRYTFITHASFLVQMDGLNILTDPIYSERASPVSFAGPKRIREPAIEFNDLPPIDIVLISHDHYDHLDRETVLNLIEKQKDNPPIFLVGLGVGSHLLDMGVHSFVELDWDQRFHFQGMDFWFVECQHRSGRGVFDQQKTLWGSFVAQGASGRFYFAGDTAYSKHFAKQGKQYGPFDFALLPIGAYAPRWFMKYVHVNPEESVLAHQELGSLHSVGMHFGTFKLTYESEDEPAKELEIAKAKYGVDAFKAPKWGDSMDFKKKANFQPLKADFGRDNPKSWLASTTLIDADHPKIKAKSLQITAGMKSDVEKARALHDYVRDKINFGWQADFADYKASQVLESRLGFCMPKTTLFVALLRSLKIPARPVFVDIAGEILNGLESIKGFSDHSFTEVYLQGKWVKTDSYAVPLLQAEKIKVRLFQEGREFGYGVALKGRSQWDGVHASFIQYVGAMRKGTRQFPLYADSKEFYRYAREPNQNGWLAMNIFYPLYFERMNHRFRSIVE